MSLESYCTIKFDDGDWNKELLKSLEQKWRRGEQDEQMDLLEAQAHIHVEEHATSHDEEVCVEEDQAMVYDEAVDTSFLA
jgi:hypothetical protein